MWLFVKMLSGAKINAMGQQRLTEFNKLAIHNRIDPYFESDIDIFFENDDQFSLNLKRSSKFVSLYGKSHVNIRQSFFNDLDQEKRVMLFKSKLKAKHIVDWIISELGISTNDVIDVIDVGKGRSVYKFTCTNGDNYIIKEKTNNIQETFHAIAKQFDIPISKSWFYQSKNTQWELTPCLDPHHVFDIKQDQLWGMFANAAVIGDIFCIGDRHFDNYLCDKNDQLVSIDISHMLDDDHDLWTKKYISGGLYECCVLNKNTSNRQLFKKYLADFFASYFDKGNYVFDQLKQKQELTGLGAKEIAVVQNKWKSPTYFFNHMQTIYINGLKQMLDRLVYKHLLEQLVSENTRLEPYPELKMYAISDIGQPSVFFRLEDVDVDIFDQIKTLSAKHLGVTPQYIDDFQMVLNTIKDAVEEFQFDQIKSLVS